MSRLRLAILSVVVLAECTSATDTATNEGTSAPSTPSTSVQGATSDGRILFTRSDETFFVNPDGTLETSVYKGCCAKWSPDGTRILIPTLTDEGRITTGIMNEDGAQVTALPLDTPGLNLGPGAWAPDGQRLALEGWDDDDPSKNGLYTSDTEGSDVVRLTTNSLGLEGHPGADIPTSYSPDGSQIAFQRSDPSGNGDRGRAAVFVIRTDGSGLYRLTPWLPGSWSGTADWSPDGTEIVYDIVDFDPKDFEAHYRGEIRVVDADGANDHQIPIIVPDDVTASPAYFAKQPSWSPDGTRIVFSMWPEWDTYGNQLFTVAPDGDDLLQVTFDDDVEHEWPDWSTSL